jgi:catechol 2,3-dioxygenase-like lactoylglutathione lyase family enzyme
MTFRIEGFQVNLFAREIEPTLEFYLRLGFAESYRTPKLGTPTHVEVRAAGLTIGVASEQIGNDQFQLKVSAGANSAEVLLWVDDADAAYADAVAAGGTSVFGPEDYQGGRVRHCWLRDPSGHLLELVQMLQVEESP